MGKKVYDAMNWRDIEEIVYSECDHPERLLGPHKVGKKTLLQTFLPGAKKVVVRFPKDNQEILMEQMDEEGYFAQFVDGVELPYYQYVATFADDSICALPECYRYATTLTKKEMNAFEKGNYGEAHKLLGAQAVEREGVRGMQFRVYAPHAMRVSVVGDFNAWDGRVYQMCRVGDSGFFELFIPGLMSGTLYQYEIKTQSRVCLLKADPYAKRQLFAEKNASVAIEPKPFTWEDAEFIENRKKHQGQLKAKSVYEVSLADLAMEGEKITYQECAKKLIQIAKEQGYTHVNLLPLMEYPVDASLGYQTIGYFAPTMRYGKMRDLKGMINALHQAGIYVVMDFTPAQFPLDDFGLRYYDGTCLYEPEDDRQKYQANGQSFKYDYASAATTNMLLSAALYWIEEFHMDGLRMNALDTMLYTNYDRNDHESVRNIYGGFENLEAIAFLQNLATVLKKKYPGVLLLAQESRAWQNLLGDPKTGGLGFDDNVQLCKESWVLQGKKEDDYQDALKVYYGYRFMKPCSKIFSGKEAMTPEAAMMIADFQKLYRKYDAMQSSNPLVWLATNCANQGIDAFLRIGKKDKLLVLVNSANVETSVEITVPEEGTYKQLMNTSLKKYGGSSQLEKGLLYALDKTIDGQPKAAITIAVTIPANTMYVYGYADFTKQDLAYIEKMRLEAQKKVLKEQLDQVEESLQKLITQKNTLQKQYDDTEKKLETYR